MIPSLANDGFRIVLLSPLLSVPIGFDLFLSLLQNLKNNHTFISIQAVHAKAHDLAV